MPRNEQDPAGDTQQFRAFASGRESARGGPSAGLIIGLAVVAVLVVAAVLVVLFG
jgi:hypothetical protein